jgi:hypothetical protein
MNFQYALQPDGDSCVMNKFCAMNKFYGTSLLALIASTTAVTAAPQSYYGKTFRVSWTETRSQRDAGETAFRPVSLPFTYTVYVSSKGQLFTRVTSMSASRRAVGSKDRVGTSGSGPDGAGRATFQGNTLTATRSSGGLGRQIRVTFDGGSSCSATVVTGKSGGGVASVRSIPTGGMVEFESVSAGAASCSVQDGNAFAN